MFRLAKSDAPMRMDRLRRPLSEPFVTTYSRVGYLIPEHLTTTLPTCAYCQTYLTAPKMCAGCMAVRYCDRACQKRAWKESHSEECHSTSRGEMRNLLLLHRALWRPCTVSTGSPNDAYDDEQFLRALHRVERACVKNGFMAHLLLTTSIPSTPIVDVDEARRKLTGALTQLGEHTSPKMHDVAGDFVVWFTRDSSESSESNHVSIRLHSNESANHIDKRYISSNA